MDALSSGGLHQAGKDAVGFQSAFRPSSEAYLTEDYQMSERLFRVIVRGGYAGAPEEGEEKFLLGSCEIGPEGLGGFETKGLFVPRFAGLLSSVTECFSIWAAAFQGISPDFSFCPASQSREHRSMTRWQKGPVAVSFSVGGRSACSALISLAFVMIWAMQACQSTPRPL